MKIQWLLLSVAPALMELTVYLDNIVNQRVKGRLFGQGWFALVLGEGLSLLIGQISFRDILV